MGDTFIPFVEMRTVEETGGELASPGPGGIVAPRPAVKRLSGDSEMPAGEGYLLALPIEIHPG